MFIITLALGLTVILQLINDNDIFIRIIGAFQLVLIAVMGFALGKNSKRKKS